MSHLTDRFVRAVDYARVAHATQVRKGSRVPYLYHPLGVASLVIEFGGSEDQVIAALLHDVVEDCGQAHAPIIREQFGDVVANIVEACTDGTAEGKVEHSSLEAKRQDWMRRKLTYIAHLREASDETLLVSACDKLHNARAIVQDLEAGQDVFARFTGQRDGTLAYYYSLADIFVERRIPPVSFVMNAVGRMHELANNDSPSTLERLATLNGLRPRKDKLQPYLDSGAMIEDDGIDGLGFFPSDSHKGT
jgi:(p)ppGpp synthase/HD superfamily hydrolase